MTVATASQVPSVGVASSGGHARTRSRVVNRAGCRQVVRARVGMEGQEFQSRRGMLFGVSQRTPATRETRSEGLSLGQIVTLADTDEAMAMEEGDEKPKFSTDLFPKPLKQAASVVITPLFFFYLWQRLQRRVEMSKTVRLKGFDRLCSYTSLFQNHEQRVESLNECLDIRPWACRIKEIY